ncbi:hypothetical protein CROQUDRAFT_652251, partial [Cronartium quercuum f. sp. fusiforme G11]
MCNYMIYSTIPAYIKCSHLHSYLGVMAIQHSTDKFLCPLRWARYREELKASEEWEITEETVASSDSSDYLDEDDTASDASTIELEDYETVWRLPAWTRT